MTVWKRQPRPGGDGADHEPQVELICVAFIAEAMAIRLHLEVSGIAATVLETGASRWAPHIGMATGSRVMVHARDLDRARALLRDVGGQVDHEAHLSTEEVRKHLRTHGGPDPDAEPPARPG